MSNLSDLVDALDTALSEGQIADAHQIHRQISRQSTAPITDPQLLQLQQRLFQLEDWQQYATNPKRESLCLEMEHLAGTNVNIEDKAQQIKQLQADWRQLGPSSSGDAQKLWQRFRTAADLAYAPCAEFFSQRDAERERHLSARQEVCQTLGQLLSRLQSDNPDWKSLDKQLKNAQKKWRKHNNVPHHSRKKLNRQYKSALAPIQDALDAEYRRNHELKQALILSIEQALEGEFQRQELVALALKTQQDWKQIGICEYRTDQKLWKQFRALMDQVFSHPTQSSPPESNSGVPPKTTHTLTDLLDEGRARRDLCLQAETGTSTAWPAQTRLPDDVLAAFVERYEGALEGEVVAADVDWLDELCIEAEMLAQVDSPPASQARRTAMQIERLEQGLVRGQRDTRSPEEKWTYIRLFWMSAARVPCALQTRFDKAAAAVAITLEQTSASP